MAKLNDELLKLQMWMDRLKPQSLEALGTNLDKAIDEITLLINSTKNKATIKKEINIIIQNAFVGIEEMTLLEMQEVSALVYNTTGAIMGAYVTNELANDFKEWKSIDTKIKESLLSKNNLIQGHTLEDHLKHLETTNIRKVRGIIYKGFDDGVGIEEISRNVRTSLSNIDRNQAKTLIRTTMLEASMKAQNEAFDYFKDEILYYVYDATLDSRTTTICLLNHGIKHERIEDFKVKPHNHWNCRSILRPVTDLSEEEEKTNLVEWDERKISHRDGTKSTKFTVGKVKKIDSNLRGIDIIKQFDDKYLESYLGKRRFDLYKSGKATLSEMYNISRAELIPLERLLKKI